MEHHYSLTGRMLAIFVGGLIVLGILLFVFGLLAGREWGASEAVGRLGAAKHSSAKPVAPAARAAAPAAVPASSPPPAALGTGAAAGAIRPAATLPPLSAAPAVPAVPKAPAAPVLPVAPILQAPKPPALPAIRSMPQLKSSTVRPAPDRAMARSSSIEMPKPRPPAVAAAASASPAAAPTKQEQVQSAEAAVHGFVVYVGAFESGAKAERIAQKLRSRNLKAQTSPVARPGRKPLVTVWVGPFDDHAGAEAALPDIHAAGLKDTMIREVP